MWQIISIMMNGAHELWKSLVRRKQNGKKNEKPVSFFFSSLLTDVDIVDASSVVVDDQVFVNGHMEKKKVNWNDE